MKQVDIERYYNLYSQDVMNVAYFYLGNKEDAEDVLVETFMRMMNKSPMHLGNIKSYLLTSAFHLSYDSLRKKKAAPLDLEITASPMHSEEVEELRKALFALPPKYKEPLILCYIEGYDAKEAAKILSLSLSALNKRLERGKKMLKEALKDE